ncbi:diguanylate cyclase (GGDEF)-like protein [Alteromonadaceae bacterium 2753L.S.0a.02]|nr:diguanylate cyclase (GGDEF)-like protein [Alteromonadaceae bacterium 2753L.S.0a.02]
MQVSSDKTLYTGIAVAILAWLGVTAVLGLREHEVPLMEKYGPVTIYTDRWPDSAANWLNEANHAFTCMFVSAANRSLCGFNIQVGNGAQRGADFRGYSSLRFAVEYRGPAEQLRISYRNATEEDLNENDTKFHEFIAPIREGVYRYEIPLDNMQVASWWISSRQINDPELLRPERDNLVHIGFDIENPMPVGQHFFKVLEFSAVSSWFAPRKVALWAGSSVAYVLVILMLVYFLRLRVTLKQRSEEMFGLLKRLEKADTESAHYKRLSMYDPLTGLLNRRAAEELVEQYGAHNSLSGTALVLLDIDHFKRVNDSYGHEVGDEILRKIGITLRVRCRSTDAVVRWGGEEIVVICPKTDVQDAVRLAEKLREEIKHLQFSASQLTVTASFGVAVIAEDQSFDTAFRHADEALYGAKSQGRDQVKQYKV